VRVTSYSGDEGIDVAILDGEGGETAGIQVKRYQGKISAEQIRSFTGALVLKGMTSGIFVTTSSFQKGAHHVKSVAQARGLAIELVDAKRFYDALRIAQRPVYTTIDVPSAPFFDRWREIGNAPIATQVAW
jgi:restriction system protein